MKNEKKIVLDFANKLKKRSLEFLESDVESSLEYAEKYAELLWKNHVGLYLDLSFEKIIIDSLSFLSTKNNKPIINSPLHLITNTSDSGGHTRVIEKILYESKNHALASVNQIDPRVKERFSSGNKYFDNLKKETKLETIINLIKVASAYKTVILHIHPSDICSAVAAGIISKNGTKVYLYNHADFNFSFGFFSAKKILQISSFGWNLGKKLDLKQSFVGIPYFVDPDLNLLSHSRSKQINILIAGSSKKFSPSLAMSIQDVMNIICEQMEKKRNIQFIVCGSHGTEIFWNSLTENCKKLTKFLGVLGYDDYLKYLMTSDCLIDSFPRSSGTVYSEAIMLKKPVFGLSKVQGYSVADSLRYSSQDQLVEEILDFLNDKKSFSRIISEVRKRLQKFHSPKIILSRIKKIINSNSSVYLLDQLALMKIDTSIFEKMWLHDRKLDIERKFMFFHGDDKVYYKSILSEFLMNFPNDLIEKIEEIHEINYRYHNVLNNTKKYVLQLEEDNKNYFFS
mgnify:CR=1 FL=1